MQAARIQELIKIYRDGLLQDTLPFWMNHCVDRECGGFMFCLGRDGRVIDTDKGVWHQGRFTWLLGELYNNVEPQREWLELARHGADFLTRHCLDPKDGRLWFHLTREGQPIRKRRYAFGESFACIAYGEYAQAGGDEEAAERARQAFQMFVQHHTIPGRMTPKFTATRPMKSIGLPMIGIVAAQELRESIRLDEANEFIDRWIEEIRRDFMKPDIECVMETVAVDGAIIDHFDGRTLNPGHAIEAAWFIMREGELRQDRVLVEMGCTILDWMWARGWDSEYGGMFYFRDVRGLPVQEYWHDMKFWWPHNETIIATLYAHHLTGDPKYAEWHRAVHDWSYAHFPDPEHGEWFGYLHRDGRLSVDLKGNLFKGPFHLPRMQLVCWKILQSMEKAGRSGVQGQKGQ